MLRAVLDKNMLRSALGEKLCLELHQLKKTPGAALEKNMLGAALDEKMLQAAVGNKICL